MSRSSLIRCAFMVSSFEVICPRNDGARRSLFGTDEDV